MTVNHSITIATIGFSIACRTETIPEKSVDIQQRVDSDQDGYLDDEDCKDEDPTIHPGQPEICNTIDNDCDGEIGTISTLAVAQAMKQVFKPQNGVMSSTFAKRLSDR